MPPPPKKKKKKKKKKNIYTLKIYFQNIFDGEKYTGNILKNILKYDEKYF